MNKTKRETTIFAGVKVAIHTLGCKVNFAESSTIARKFRDEGYEIVRDKADIYVVNSCSVTAAADKKCRNLIAKLHRHTPNATIIVTGCYAARAPEIVGALEGVSQVWERDFARFVPACSMGDRTRSFLKIQDGCDYCCSYCTIHRARGNSRNAPIADLVEQAREIAASGVKEIVLTGINTGDFGRSTGEKFVDLLRELDRVEGIERYRISSIEPNLLTDEIVDFCASSDKFQPHFHIPLQSGYDRILGLMRRRYTTEKFAAVVKKVREVMPSAFFGIDVIVGFPGETNEDFEQTYRFLSELRPAELHVFPFSARPGTPAAEMPGKVAPKIVAERAARLGELSRNLHAEFVARHAGTRAKVLLEADKKNGMMHGFTGNYIRVAVPYDPAKVNTIEEMEITPPAVG